MPYLFAVMQYFGRQPALHNSNRMCRESRPPLSGSAKSLLRGQPLRHRSAEHLRIRFDRLGARDRQVRADMTNFLHVQRSVPGEGTVRRDNLDVKERCLVADVVTQVNEDGDSLAVDIQRSAFLQQLDEVGRDSEFITAAVIEQRPKSVAIGLYRQRPPVPLPARKDTVVRPTGIGRHAMAQFTRRRTANREAVGQPFRAKEGCGRRTNSAGCATNYAGLPRDPRCERRTRHGLRHFFSVTCTGVPAVPWMKAQRECLHVLRCRQPGGC